MNTKRKEKYLAWLLTGAAVLLAAALVLLPPSGEQPSPESAPRETMPLTNPQEAVELGDGLRIERMDRYAGIYMEDGSNEVVQDVMMLQVRNTSEQDLQLARIRVHYADFTAEFEVTNLPAGAQAVLLERSRRSVVSEPWLSAEAQNVVFFPEPMELEHQIASRDGILLHASWIRWQDRAILFTAPSGVGKSTQAELWCRLRGAELMNGDRTAVFADQGGGVQVRGIPLAGSSGVCQNVQMPLTAIVYLSQAKETTIAPLTGFRAFRSIWEGCSVTALDREDAQRSLQTVMTVLEQIPVYHLACTPDESAVAALEQALRKGD